MSEGEIPPKLKPYGAAEMFADKFEEKRKTSGKEQYEGTRGGILFLRYYNRYRDRYEDTSKRFSKNINPLTVDTFTNKHPLREHVDLPRLAYKDLLHINHAIRNINPLYNTEDGAFKWLLDQGLPNVNIYAFLSIVPAKVRSSMNMWRPMNMSAIRASLLYNKLLEIDDSYNTMDGPARWLNDNGFPKENLPRLAPVMPKAVRNRMTRWTFGSGWGPEYAQKQQQYMENIRSYIAEKHTFDDPSAEKRILMFLWRTRFSAEKAKATLDIAFINADNLMTQLSIARLVQPEQHEFTMENLHELYSFAEKHLKLEPEVVWIILRLKRINMLGVGNLVRQGYRKDRRNASLETPARKDAESPALEDRLGYLDPGFSQVEARLVLEKISESGHLSLFELEVLEDVINGKDLDDELYKILTKAIRSHPELLELLGVEEE